MEDYFSVSDDGTRKIAAPKHLWPNLRTPTKEEYNAKGYYTDKGIKPEPPEGQQVASIKYVVEDNEITEVYTYEDIPAIVRTFSTMKLYIALANIGLWDKFTEWLKSQTIGNVNLYTAFDRANDLVEDHPMFKPYVTMAQTALGVDDETLEKILSESIAE